MSSSLTILLFCFRRSVYSFFKSTRPNRRRRPQRRGRELNKPHTTDQQHSLSAPTKSIIFAPLSNRGLISPKNSFSSLRCVYCLALPSNEQESVTNDLVENINFNPSLGHLSVTACLLNLSININVAQPIDTVDMVLRDRITLWNGTNTTYSFSFPKPLLP